MPSAEHESPVALAKQDSEVLARLLTKVFDVKVIEYHHARPHATDVRVLVPRTYHADAVTVYCDSADRPLLAVVFEVQRRWDTTKRRTWKLYVAQLEAELDVDTALVVYCSDAAVAQRYRDMFAADGLCLKLRPLIFTPDDVPLVADAESARADPSLAVLSTICHGDAAEVDAAFPALVEALHVVGPKKAILYYDIVLAGLPPAARVRWEAFMTTTAGYEFRSELLRNLAAEQKALGEAEGMAQGMARGRAEGVAEGEAQAVLTVLAARGVAVRADVRDRILACTDLARLEAWLRRAVSATSIDDVLES